MRSVLKAALEASAEQAGRSVSEEIEHRLEQSLDRQNVVDEIFGLLYQHPNLAGFMRVLGEIARSAIAHGSRDQPQAWADDPRTYAVVAAALTEAVAAHRPVGELSAEAAGQAEELGRHLAHAALHGLLDDARFRERHPMTPEWAHEIRHQPPPARVPAALAERVRRNLDRNR
jgi:hypothetical protein